MKDVNGDDKDRNYLIPAIIFFAILNKQCPRISFLTLVIVKAKTNELLFTTRNFHGPSIYENLLASMNQTYFSLATNPTSY